VRGSLLQLVDLRPDILSAALAELDLVLHGLLDVVHIVVDHGQGDAHGQNGDDREGHGRVGHETIGLDTMLKIHDEGG